MVGGRDFFGDGDFAKLNLASGTGRQAGSSMKPIALAAALQTGIPVTSRWNAPVRLTIDEPQICGGRWNIRGGTGGNVSLVRATRSSLNTVYAQLMVAIRPDVYVDWAERLGIGEGRLEPVCAAVLGSENVNMVEMATVFSTFSRSGTRIDPVLVTEVVNPDGTLLYEYSPSPIPVLSQSVAHQLTWVLEGVITGGTGRRAQLADGRPAAGKTGTAQLNGDATFIGYTAQRTTAVWVGFPEEVTPMSNYFNGGRRRGRHVPGAHLEGGDGPGPRRSPRRGVPGLRHPARPPRRCRSPRRRSRCRISSAAASTRPSSARWRAGTCGSTRSWSRPTKRRKERSSARFRPAGQEVPGNTLISVGVAVAPLDAPVPNVLGFTEAVARQTLNGDGFLQEVTYETDPEPGEDGVVGGIVWAQDPPGGTDRDGVETVRIKVNPLPDARRGRRLLTTAYDAPHDELGGRYWSGTRIALAIVVILIVRDVGLDLPLGAARQPRPPRHPLVRRRRRGDLCALRRRRSTACPARPPTPRSPTGPTRSAEGTRLTVGDGRRPRGRRRAESPTRPTVKLLEAWFADWDAYVRDREAYVERLSTPRRADAERSDLAFTLTERSSGGIYTTTDRRTRQRQRHDVVPRAARRLRPPDESPSEAAKPRSHHAPSPSSTPSRGARTP